MTRRACASRGSEARTPGLLAEIREIAETGREAVEGEQNKRQTSYPRLAAGGCSPLQWDYSAFLYFGSGGTRQTSGSEASTAKIPLD